jgi:glycosyltransferase involved in cell wall biosynthesis
MQVKPVILSVLLQTFNHEKYIVKCIESILSQTVNFQMEVLIGDDCSTDSNQSLIVEAVSKNEDSLKTIILQLHKKNLSPELPGKTNFLRLYESANGKYIIIIDGDDFWTDPYKLQKQVDFLENNLNYAICFHEVEVLEGNNFYEDNLTRDVPETTNILNLAEGNYIHTPSAVFRNNITQIPEWFHLCPLGDFALHMINAQFGSIKKMPEKMAVYRKHANSFYSSKSELENITRWTQQLVLMQNYFKGDVNRKLIESLIKSLKVLIVSDEIDDTEKKRYIHQLAIYDENYASDLYFENKKINLELLSVKRAVLLLAKRIFTKIK